MNLIKQLDKVFSEYIRLRDAVNGIVICPLCDSKSFWRYSDCMHFVSRDNMATRYCEINCNAGCKNCNQFKSGNTKEYRRFLISKYGLDKVIDLEARGRSTLKLMNWEIEAMITVYKLKIKDLKDGNNKS